MKTITYIPIDKLYEHPRNPRLNVGDVSELCESIRQKGVLQNLTVVECGDGVPDGVDGYTVIIGHRRLAAARQAGLTELPCVIADMTEAEQQETMLLENMQRTDLTILEQAQGFQLLLSMGHTQQSISQKTGFSPATVSRRLKIAQLNPDKVADGEQRGGTLEDFIKISEIKDTKERDELLDELGTNNFNWKYQSALRKQKITEKEPEILKELESIAMPLTGKSWDDEHNYLMSVSFDKYEPGIFKEKIKPGKVYQYTAVNGVYTIYEFRKIKKLKKTQTSKKRIVADNAREDLARVAAKAFEMRKNFIENFTAFKSHKNEIADFMTMALYAGAGYGYDRKTSNLLIKLDNYQIHWGEFTEQYKNRGAELQVKIAYAAFGDSERNKYYDDSCGEEMPEWDENKELDCLYDCLKALGYQMSDEEKALQDGTHELFTSDKGE